MIIWPYNKEIKNKPLVGKNQLSWNRAGKYVQLVTRSNRHMHIFLQIYILLEYYFLHRLAMIIVM